MKPEEIFVPDRVYLCNADLLPDDILSWQSVDPGTIRLPCRTTEAIQRAAREILADHIRYRGDSGMGNIETIISTATSTLELLVYRFQMCGPIYLSLPFANGKTITKSLLNTMPPKFCRPILAEFFRRGGLGLTEEKREIWQQRYGEWLDWRRMRYGSYYNDSDDIYDNTGESDNEPMMIPRTEAMPYQPDN